MPTYGVRLDYVFQANLNVDVEADSEEQAIALAKEKGDIAEAHAEASHYETTVYDVEVVENA
jgi:hypothetical protein